VLTLKFFLGGINFYRKFILYFSQLAKPLHHLSNHSTFLWTLLAQEQFHFLKKVLCSTTILCLCDLKQPFEIETDASQLAIGAILKHGGHPIYYHSKTLVQAKQHYITYDILGKETILHTDDHPLIFIFSQSELQ
jgi:hypothetical protein